MSDLTENALDAVAAQAQRADPGLPPETARLLAGEALLHVADGVRDAPELARLLLADHPEAGASAAAVVARAATSSPESST
ncbi:MAG: hypothetical protein JWN17_938 [Frankiales bacterium]|nr:hypothetical protein [Frankiales bacterium]